MKNLLIFDLDGVLVAQLGYRRAVEDTLNRLGEQLGLSALYPGDDALANFEAHSITNEWDMLPLLLAIRLDQLQQLNPAQPLPPTLMALRSWSIKAQPKTPADPAPYLARFGMPQNGEGFSEHVLAIQKRSGNLFPALKDHPILDELLADTGNLAQNLITRLFQNFTLGTTAYQQVYQHPAEVTCPSSLKTHDRININAQNRQMVLDARNNPQFGISICTARPSLVDDPTIHAPEISPEAEQALELLGFEPIPHIGGGDMVKMAARLGQPFSACVKPALPHLLAAVLAALLGDAGHGFAQALALLQGKPVNLPAQPFAIHYFEDSPATLKSMTQTSLWLNQRGFVNTCHLYGIGQTPAKVQALQKAGIPAYGDVNMALQKLFEAISNNG